MLTLEEIKKDMNLVSAINWDMTPEEAVLLYLEWGNNWAHGNYVIRSKNDVSHYFVVNTWGKRPVVYFIRRNSEEAVELAEIPIPDELMDEFFESNGNNKGVYAIEGGIKNWLKSQLN
jgi:hypothetical protein